MTGYLIYSVKKIKFASVYVPYPADVSGQKSGALITHSDPPGGWALECNLKGRSPFLKNFNNSFRKKICISIPCFGIIRLQKNFSMFLLLFSMKFDTELENYQMTVLNKADSYLSLSITAHAQNKQFL